MQGPRWAERAAEQMEKAVENGDMTDAEYEEEMRGLRDEVREAAQDAYDDAMNW